MIRHNMHRVVQKKEIAPSTYAIKVDAGEIAGKVRAGQFVVVRVDQKGERIPLTIAETYPESGLIKIIFQEVGLTTKKLRCIGEGGEIADLVGPLGTPTDLRKWGTVVLVSGPRAMATGERQCPVTI